MTKERWGSTAPALQQGNISLILCCLLNSQMGNYLLKDSPKTGTGDLLVSVQAIEPVMAAYNKTIENVSEHSGVSRDRIQKALDDLMNNKYITEETKYYKGKRPKVLVVNWKRAIQDGIWRKGKK